MKSFTLIETVLALSILVILFGIVFRTSVFQKDVYYLGQEVKKLRHFLSLARDLSFTNQRVNNQKVCAVGILFQNNQYQGVAYVTLGEDCQNQFRNNPNSFANINAYLLENGFISQDEKDPLRIIEEFQGSLVVKTNCQDTVQNDVLILFINPYGDPVFFQRQNNAWNNIANNFPLCFSLKYKNDEKTIKINKIGQILLQ